MKKIVFSLFILCFSGLNTLKAQNGDELFKKNCSPCHTIGGGKLVGPDLAGIQDRKSLDWIIKFTKSSSKMINSGDVGAVAIFNEFMKMPMPDQNLSDQEITAVLKHISGGSVTSSATTEVQTEFINSATKKDVENGFLLFTGKKKFSNKGASCISCHTINDKRVFAGGNIAKDLSMTYTNLKAAGIKAILSAPPFPTMTQAYKNATLTEKEIFDLTAYIKSADRKQMQSGLNAMGSQFLMYGFLLFLLLNLIIALYWNKGKIRSTNRDILRRQKRTI